ncbi:MAG: FHA domain-containing protein [Anaerolineae bacterium]|jgi:hypothetical protein
MSLDVVLLLLRILLALLLYAFLAVLVVFLWRDLRLTAGRRPAPPSQGRLVVVQSGEEGPEEGKTFPLREVTSLGRNVANVIVLPDCFVSAHHALLAWREDRWWLEDQDSRNGTTLNGEPVTRPTVVSAGDLIGVGRVILRFEVER